MKRVIVCCLMLSLSACASMYGKDSNPERNKVSQKQRSYSEYDQTYVASVERQALQRGVMVKWISPPRARKVKKDGQ